MFLQRVTWSNFNFQYNNDLHTIHGFVPNIFKIEMDSPKYKLIFYLALFLLQFLLWNCVTPFIFFCNSHTKVLRVNEFLQIFRWFYASDGYYFFTFKAPIYSLLTLVNFPLFFITPHIVANLNNWYIQ